MDDDFRQAALDYHRYPQPGKLSVEPTKRMANQRDLALAYSPGVAAACEAIVADPDQARELTARGNLVAVISNGTAVLGLGNIGPLAGKPVMEGKAVLFKKFAGLDVFDIEVDATDPDHFVEVVAALEPTFGGINLEDIKAPECFAIEAKLRERMNIPVFHDDQHGTAIVVAAAVRNALLLQGKTIGEARLVTSGAGAAALACVDLLVAMGMAVENVTITDIKGVIYKDRDADMLPNMARYARNTDARTLGDVIEGADIFLGLSAPRVFKPEWLPLLAERPVILAMANPEPEILPELIAEQRPDAIVATGRSDYPNQVNNVLCFPYIFRGALDCGATAITPGMEIAAVEAIAALARAEPDETVARAYGGRSLLFGPGHIIPAPFDPRLATEIAPAVARAAAADGVATRPITDFDAYKRKLQVFTYRSNQLMTPVFERARTSEPQRIAYAEAEDERILRAAQIVVDERLAKPVLVGRRDVITARIAALGLRIREGEDVEIADPGADDALFAPLVPQYQALVDRKGVTPAAAERRLRSRPAVSAAMLLKAGHVDAALCGGSADWWQQTTYILPIIPRREEVTRVSAMTALIVGERTLFFCDTHMNVDPSTEEVAELAVLAARAVRSFGIVPKGALLSHSNFGAAHTRQPRKMRDALKLIRAMDPELVIDGEMHADTALSAPLRERIVGSSALGQDSANLLIFPTLDAANISLTLLTASAEGLVVGPMLLGMSKPIHVLTSAATARTVVNMTALAVAAG
jgi:malate dehydrogenase (oxaloacetate-decarboxylating)(NADP+)